jgi:hydroxymethylglutaryl-CoA lyase
MVETLQLVECPRDAMQGWKTIIPSQKKISYINSLLKVGFHTIDMGSFVSPKFIPQMADTAEVVAGIDDSVNLSELLVIVANTRGAEQALSFDRVSYLGFPFSVSATFQKRNTNSSPEESLLRVTDMQGLCVASGKKLVVYMSMGFGNPYGDPYNEDILASWMKKIAAIGVPVISLADTVGVATPQQVSDTVSAMVPLFPGITIGVHLHSHPDQMLEKLDAAYLAGCRRFDGAINGIGGCPMADDELVGNMDTIKMVRYFQQKGHLKDLNNTALEKCRKAAMDIFI